MPQKDIFGLKFRQLGKLGDANFKYDNVVFMFQPKNTEISHYCFHILRIFIFPKFPVIKAPCK